MEKNQDSIGLASEFRRMEKTKFCSVSQEGLLSSEERKKNQDSFVSSEERKRTKIRSGGLSIFGKSGTKIRKIGWISEFRSTEKNQDSFRVDFRILKNGKSRFISNYES
ncbi:hypothetical protein RIR_jg11865.t1 [Rhizophagus irregularis DAOM 181602=DAOM 197198]|nr:hypothetical protein RIR_jg11865.t1 [Rhizophagus irregularis DAOM 181602=DAOM 197198]